MTRQAEMNERRQGRQMEVRDEIIKVIQKQIRSDGTESTRRYAIQWSEL